MLKGYKLYTDGGSRGNPGPGAIGVVLLNKDEVVYELSKYIGICTNNEAEYKALQEGLKEAAERKIETLECFLDSELIAKQLKGDYKVKNARLKVFYDEVIELKGRFKSVSFSHVKREKNKRADSLVNKALDLNGY